MTKKCLLLGLGAFCAWSARSDDFVPFVIPSYLPPDRIWKETPTAIDVTSPRLEARDGHFFRAGQRVRLWGVNLSFGGCLPSKEEAPLIAERLASAGLNAVRLHHLDTDAYPRGLWDPFEAAAFHPEALDRLDYFIDQLARQGVMVNLNLHVGRAHSRALGLPAPNTDMDKIVGLFTPALIDAQKQYARALLHRTNRYRDVRYADDPAIALLEISNEDSFFTDEAEQKLPVLPAYYRAMLQQQFNLWLSGRYGSNTALREAWQRGVEAPGAELIRNGSFIQWQSPQTLNGWNKERHVGCDFSLERSDYEGRQGLRVNILKADGIGWHAQLTSSGLALESGRYYTVRFWAAAAAPRPLAVTVSQAQAPWKNLGLRRALALTSQWQFFEIGFQATDTTPNGRLCFELGESEADVHLARVECTPGGRTGLRPEERMKEGTVTLFGGGETTPRIIDRMLFLVHTEKTFYDGMRTFLRRDLGCAAPITGTIGYGPLALLAQSDMDFVDAHAYWNHPTFPGKPWDPVNWMVRQTSMTDRPEESTLAKLAFSRLAGKPFTVTEYSHPAPNDSQAEGIPMVASFAAAQDWDGVWLYAYSHDADLQPDDYFKGFFDIRAHPAKFGFLPAGAALFRQAGIPPLPSAAPVSFEDAARLQTKFGSRMLDAAGESGPITPEALCQRAWAITLLRPNGTVKPKAAPTSAARMAWTVPEKRQGVYTAEGPGAWVFTGYAVRSESATNGRFELQSPAFAAVTMTPIDGASFSNTAALLVTACGRAENLNMTFDHDRQTVGKNWGEAPARIEAVRGRLRLPEGAWRAAALHPDGRPREAVQLIREGRAFYLPLDPAHRTMWYLIERK